MSIPYYRRVLCKHKMEKVKSLCSSFFVKSDKNTPQIIGNRLILITFG